MSEIHKSSIAHTKRECFWIDNAVYARTNKAFKKACERVKLQPTKRQASKYRMKKGLAYKGVTH